MNTVYMSCQPSTGMDDLVEAGGLLALMSICPVL